MARELMIYMPSVNYIIKYKQSFVFLQILITLQISLMVIRSSINFKLVSFKVYRRTVSRKYIWIEYFALHLHYCFIVLINVV